MPTIIRTMRRPLVILALLLAALTLAAAGFGFARAAGLPDLFGNKMIRAEVVESDGSVYDLYRGRLAAADAASVTVREADGHVDVVPVNDTTRVTFLGAPVSVTQLRRGMRVTVVRPSNGPALVVQALRR
jgi:hypothetical protein